MSSSEDLGYRPATVHASSNRSGPRQRTQRARPHPVASGAFLALAPAPFAVASWLYGPLGLTPLVAAVIIGLGFLSAGWVIVLSPRIGRFLGTGGLLSLVALAAPGLRDAPELALLALATTTLGVALLWNVGGLVGPRAARRSLPEGQTHGAAVAALALWIVSSLVSRKEPNVEILGISLAFVVVAVLAVRWIWRAGRVYRARTWLLLAALAFGALLSWELRGHGWLSLLGAACFAASALGIVPRQGREERGLSDWSILLDHPERLLVGTFATLAMIGTLVLALPRSSSLAQGVGLMDAAFSAVSAVCVTGLIVRDTPVDYTLAGQVAILVLIQLGGLGIMTFSTAAFSVFGRRMSLRHEGAMARLLSTEDRSSLSRSAARILLLTLVTEVMGATLLTIGFLRAGDGFGAAAWRGTFTAISAFCNAGFALQSDSLVSYQSDPLVLYAVSSLIIVGSLSPAAVLTLPRLFRRPARPIPAEVRIGWTAAAFLLVVGFLFMLTFEWRHALGGLSVADKLHNAWFQSVTLRTAGFNSIDFVVLQPATLSLMMLWMFIGGTPGGTAGGIKTTTAALLVLAVIHAVRGSEAITAFGRRISERSMRKATVVATLALTGFVSGLVAVLLTQVIDPTAAAFEVVSALATVGLSIGATAELDGVGKIIIIVCMFVGRVGSLTLLMFLSQRVGHLPIGRPEEDVAVG